MEQENKSAAEDKSVKDKVKKPKLTPTFTILESALKAWWKNLKKIILVYLWGVLFALIPLVVVLIFMGLNAWMGNSVSLAFRTTSLVIMAAGVLAAIYFFIRAYMSVFLLVKRNYEGKELDIFKATGKLFWPYIGLTLLTTIFILLWSLLLIIPGIIYSVFYSLAAYAFFFEDKRGMTAIRRSVRLVRNYWWPVFGRFIVIGIAVWLFMIIISLPLSFTANSSLFFHLWNGLIQVINFLIGPIVLLFTYYIYQDLVKIKK